jgi:hypothetical protein
MKNDRRNPPIPPPSSDVEDAIRKVKRFADESDTEVLRVREQFAEVKVLLGSLEQARKAARK